MKKKGFTLIEVLVTALIASMIGTSVVFVIANSNKILFEGVAEAFKNTNTQRVMDLISTDIRRGARLSSINSNTLIIMDANDNNLFKWTSNDGVLTRTIYDDMGNSSIGNIKIISSANRQIRINIAYATFITGQFYNVKVNVHLEELSNSFNLINTTKLSNVFYCRLDPLL